MVRAGEVSSQRMLLYGVLGAVPGLVAGAAIVAGFGIGRIFTGILAGVLLTVALLVLMFRRDGIELGPDRIERRTLWRRHTLGWDRVVAARFTLGEGGRWELALDLVPGEEPPYGELILLSIPPVVRPVGNAYEDRKREQVGEIRNLLRDKKIPVTILPGIALALTLHWKLTPPSAGNHRQNT
ncbi:hypothetical protein [Nocardia stercoris]|uniref:PH domain-containing protein n=1 Tax=Nocardia stercoris TaxID=2483361 RepID=A0A3M2L8W6_9NOCA|nr:hypothetical protein [Nocardia stercoris]RMI31008.1 hypothetical protein EBN03_20535 [Nocardia stercoris]